MPVNKSLEEAYVPLLLIMIQVMARPTSNVYKINHDILTGYTYVSPFMKFYIISYIMSCIVSSIIYHVLYRILIVCE